MKNQTTACMQKCQKSIRTGAICGLPPLHKEKGVLYLRCIVSLRLKAVSLMLKMLSLRLPVK